LKERNITCSILEYTLFMIGIHEDTGSCVNTGTTWRDAQAVAELLKSGANLLMAQQFLESRISPEQEGLYQKLLSSKERWEIKGNIIHFYRAVTGSYVEDADVVVQRLRENDGARVLFCLLTLPKKSYLIARSRNDRVQVGEILATLGGGGHKHAASATIEETDWSSVRLNLLKSLEKTIRPGRQASEIMQSPVKSVDMDITIGDAHKILLRYGFGGLPVVDGNGKLTGIISRQDMAKAILHDFSHAPVRAYMTQHAISMNPETPLEVLEMVMMQRQISRIPIVDRENRLLGIVTRGDLFNSLYNGTFASDYHTTFLEPRESTRNVSRVLENLPASALKTLHEIGRLADQERVGCFLVGGIVRDLIMSRSSQDIDIVIEGDAIKFGKQIENCFRGASLHFFPKFGTVSLKISGLRIDFASARVEFYETPAALPDVELSSLKNDLYRRDFTVNSLAIRLNHNGFGDLADYYGGYQDIADGLIRILHRMSFVEDPTRILRAVRFSSRFSFAIEEMTLRMLKTALSENVFKLLTPERIGKELACLCQEEDFSRVLSRFNELKLSRLIFGLSVDERNLAALKRVDGLIKETGIRCNRFQINLLVLTESLSIQKTIDFLKCYKLSDSLSGHLERYLEEQHFILKHLSKNRNFKNSELFKILSAERTEILIFQQAVNENKFYRENIRRYLNLTGIKLKITGSDLIGLGLKSSPEIGSILSEIRSAKLDGFVNSKEEELSLARKLMRKIRPQ
ncbi:MAG: CBS domain-containing protein, partial [Candidatus Wallbacteria bacterium]|nr:CBS domain-containing protein [Candidatus Wallbacteria bacterium]